MHCPSIEQRRIPFNPFPIIVLYEFLLFFSIAVVIGLSSDVAGGAGHRNAAAIAFQFPRPFVHSARMLYAVLVCGDARIFLQSINEMGYRRCFGCYALYLTHPYTNTHHPTHTHRRCVASQNFLMYNILGISSSSSYERRTFVYFSAAHNRVSSMPLMVRMQYTISKRIEKEYNPFPKAFVVRVNVHRIVVQV